MNPPQPNVEENDIKIRLWNDEYVIAYGLGNNNPCIVRKSSIDVLFNHPTLKNHYTIVAQGGVYCIKAYSLEEALDMAGIKLSFTENEMIILDNEFKNAFSKQQEMLQKQREK